MLSSDSIIDHLLAKEGPIFLSLHYEVFRVTPKLVIWHVIVSKIFSLLSCDVTSQRLCISVVVFWYFVSSLLEHPVILVIVVVTALVHQVLENFAHIVVVWPLLKLQISAVLQISVEFFWDSTRQRFDCR